MNIFVFLRRNAKNHNITMKNRILTMSIALFAGIALTSLVSDCIYSYRLEAWKSETREALRGVVAQEIKKRSEKEGSIYSCYVKEEISTDEFVAVDTAFKETSIWFSSGENKYVFSSYKDEHNIEKSPIVRGFHSYLFQRNPLDVDSLRILWNAKLKKDGCPGEGTLRVNVGGTEQASASEGFSQADSLDYFTIGHSCEIEITAFAKILSYQLYSWSDGGLLLLCFSLCSLLTWVSLNARYFYDRYFVQKIPVVMVEQKHPCCYQLMDGTIFNRDDLSLEKNESRVSLTFQSAELLLLLVQAHEETVSIQKLIDGLWPDGSGNDARLHQAISRLNKSLKSISACKVENRRGVYRLVAVNQLLEKSDIS